MKSFVHPLTEKQELVVNNIANHVHGFYNTDFTNIENDIPTGIVILRNPKEQVNVDDIPLQALSYLAICAISTPIENDNYFKSFVEQLQKAVPQYSKNPPNLLLRNPETGTDSNYWQAELGEDENSFAGIYKRTVGRKTRYYVCVQAGAPQASKDLRQELKKNPNMTYEQLLHDPKYSYSHYLAQRNVERLAFNVAKACRILIKNTQDTGAYIGEEYMGKPMRAIPTYIQASSNVAQLGDHVGIFNRVTPISQGQEVQFVYEGPYHGIAVFNMKGNSTGIGLPNHSGRHEIESLHEVSESITERTKGILFEKMNAADHPDIYQNTFRTAIDDENYKQHMNKLGWKTEGLHNMIPVLVKFWDPTVKRK